VKLNHMLAKRCLKLAGETPTRVRSKEEYEFQQDIVTLAQFFGWRVLWVRPVRIQRKDGTYYYETPVAANGKGWFDTFLVKERGDNKRMIWAEIKTDSGTLDPDQIAWQQAVNAAGGTAVVWRPRDMNAIQRELEA